VIPKINRAVFKTELKVPAKKPFVKAVIKINGEHFVPIKNKTVKPIVINGVTYIPVQTAPSHLNKSSAIKPNSNGSVDIFKKGNITYIPLKVIPKVFRAAFKPAKIVEKKKSA